MWLTDWFARRRLKARAAKLVEEAFASPRLLNGTSLKSRHLNRWVLVDFEAREERVLSIRFGIVRHPRPYPFSPQSHKVMEVYRYDVEAGKIERLEGRNLTRERGRDAD